jgi:hypothetical protein
MDFIDLTVGLVIGVAGTVLGYLALKAQLKQTDKRLHYIRFVGGLGFSREELTREAIEFSGTEKSSLTRTYMLSRSRTREALP